MNKVLTLLVLHSLKSSFNLVQFKIGILVDRPVRLLSYKVLDLVDVHGACKAEVLDCRASVDLINGQLQLF